MGEKPHNPSLDLDSTVKGTNIIDSSTVAAEVRKKERVRKLPLLTKLPLERMSVLGLSLV